MPKVDNEAKAITGCLKVVVDLDAVLVSYLLDRQNTRHCVNSISMVFVHEGQEIPEMIKELDG